MKLVLEANDSSAKSCLWFDLVAVLAAYLFSKSGGSMRLLSFQRFPQCVEGRSFCFLV